MTPLAANVDRGLQIIREIQRLESELKLIEDRLKLVALEGEQVDLADPEREGKQFLARGTEATVPVVITADQITGSFIDEGPQHQKILALADGKLANFFRKSITWKNVAKSGKEFRKLAAQIFDAETAPKFVDACLSRDKYGIAKSQIKVEWDRAKKEEA